MPAQDYPDPDWRDLRAAIAAVHAVDPALILCGAGSMELLAATARAFLGPGDRALTPAYGYLFFETAARLAGAAVDRAPARAAAADAALCRAGIVLRGMGAYALPSCLRATVVSEAAMHRAAAAIEAALTEAPPCA